MRSRLADGGLFPETSVFRPITRIAVATAAKAARIPPAKVLYLRVEQSRPATVRARLHLSPAFLPVAGLLETSITEVHNVDFTQRNKEIEIVVTGINRPRRTAGPEGRCRMMSESEIRELREWADGARAELQTRLAKVQRASGLSPLDFMAQDEDVGSFMLQVSLSEVVATCSLFLGEPISTSSLLHKFFERGAA